MKRVDMNYFMGIDGDHGNNPQELISHELWCHQKYYITSLTLCHTNTHRIHSYLEYQVIMGIICKMQVEWIVT